MICKKDFGDCICENREGKMASLRNNPHFIYKMCRICEKHYALCKCPLPDWTTSHDGVELKDVRKEE